MENLLALFSCLGVSIERQCAYARANRRERNDFILLEAAAAVAAAVAEGERSPDASPPAFVSCCDEWW